MKTIVSLLLWLAPMLAFSQVIDSSIVRQVDSLIKVSRTLTGEQRFDEALKVGEQADQLALGVFGRESAEYAGCLFNRGRVYYFMRKYDEAEPLYLTSKDIRQKIMGTENLEYTSTLLNLAVLYIETGDYQKAEYYALETTITRNKLLGKENKDYATSAFTLANIYNHTGRFEDAERLYLEVLDIRKRLTGENSRDYSNALNSLSALYYRWGRYAEAEQNFIQTIRIQEKILGKENGRYLGTLNNIATIYNSTGRYKKAEKIYLEIKEAREKVLGKEHTDYATTLNDLSVVYCYMAQYDLAEKYCLEAHSIYEKSSLGNRHPDYAINLNNLGMIKMYKGEYKTAETYYLRAIDIRKEALGLNHPDYAQSLNNFAYLCATMKKYDVALQYNFEAKRIRERILGTKNQDYIASLSNIGDLYRLLEQYGLSQQYYLDANRAEKSLVSFSVRHLAEQEISSYIIHFGNITNRCYSFDQIKGQENIEFLDCSFDNALFYKSFLLNISSEISNLAARDTAATRLHNLLKSYHRRLAAEYAKPIAERKNVAELEEKANATEKELVRTVAGFGEAIRQVNWQEVQSALKPGEAAVEFIHYNYYTPDPTDSIMYAALVLRTGDEHPRMIPLFEERQLAPLLRGAQGRDFDLIDQRYAFRNGKNALRALIWQPLDSLLRGVNTVYCSPSGLLHRVNLGAIPLNSSQTFSDRYRLILVGSTRQLVINNSSSSVRRESRTGRRDDSNAALFGGIQYDSKAATVPTQASDSDDTRGTTALPFPYDTTLRGGDNSPWRPLPATETEVRNIASMLQKSGFKADLQTGPAATEETFKQLGKNEPSPRILHLATHGYFFPDPKSEVRGETVRSETSEPVFKLSDHPMIRAGLILAGANPTWTSGKPPAQGEDGILTAYEISQMNLSNTELVVLSACETGLGDLVGNEGVYGLQRAFKIAGAKYLIMSLWQVSDRMTGELMGEFYQQYLEEKKPVPDAFRGAQRAMRAKYPGSASAWAGFVLVE